MLPQEFAHILENGVHLTPFPRIEITGEEKENREANVECEAPTPFPRFGRRYIGLDVGFVLNLTFRASHQSHEQEAASHQRDGFGVSLIPQEFVQIILRTGFGPVSGIQR